MSEFTAKQKSAGVLAPPPAIVLISSFLGWVLELLNPLTFVLSSFSFQGGVMLSISALSLAGWAVLTFKKNKTAINPYSATSFLVSQGPYRHSRNPMYLALLILQMGAGFLMTSTWVQIMTVPSALLLKYGVIMREEAYLHELFGDDYKHYQERVRRWI